MLSNVNQDFLEKNLYKYGVVLSSSKIFLDNEKMEFMKKWNYDYIHGNYLYVHPLESKLMFNIFNTTVVIVGDVFVAHGSLSIEKNIQNFISYNDWSYIDNLSGRFVFFIINDSDTKVFTDPLGSKTIYYYSKSNEYMIGSHSSLLASILNIDASIEMGEYIEMNEYRSKGTRFLPGDLTMFDNIFGLCPNNYFSSKLRKTVRFWPRGFIQQKTIEDLNNLFYEYFMNFVNFVYKNDYNPIFGLTAGVDTRAVMSPFSKLNKDFYTITWDRAIDDDEKRVIDELKDYLGRKHVWLNTKEVKKSNLFQFHRDIANYNSGFSRGKCSLTAQMNEIVNANDIFVRGLGGEVIRGMFNRGNMKNKAVKELSNIDFITRLYNSAKITSPSHDYKMRTYKYLLGFYERNNLNQDLIFDCDLGDLIYWEQRMGMWASNLHNEMDSAVKGFSGINSRILFETAYGIPSEKRFDRCLLLELGKIFDKELCSMEYV